MVAALKEGIRQEPPFPVSCGFQPASRQRSEAAGTCLLLHSFDQILSLYCLSPGRQKVASVLPQEEARKRGAMRKH